jgi:hypothetical protein
MLFSRIGNLGVRLALFGGQTISSYKIISTQVCQSSYLDIADQNCVVREEEGYDKREEGDRTEEGRSHNRYKGQNFSIKGTDSVLLWVRVTWDTRGVKTSMGGASARKGREWASHSSTQTAMLN